MFDRYPMALCAAALIGFAACAPNASAPQRSVQRPLWNELPSYRTPELDAETPPPAGIEEPQGELELRDALALSLLHNPRLADVAWSVRIREARAVQAALRPNPELELEVEEFGGSGPRRDFSGAETTVRLSQVIELGGKRGARKRAAEVGRTLAEYDYEAQRLTMLTDATLGFIDVLVAQDRLDLAEDLYALSQETYNAAAERVRAGKVSPLEETKASIEMVHRRIARGRAESDLRIARLRLAATWGNPDPQFSQAAGSLDRIEDIPPLDNLEDLVHCNPDIARWAAEMQGRLSDLALERARRMFDITLSAGVTRFEENGDYAFTLGLSMPLPVFDRNQGEVRAARYSLKQADHRAKDARVRIATALAEWYEELAEARVEALALQDEVIPSAERAFEAARDGYRQGKFGYLEVLDAERTFAETNIRFLESLGRYHRAVVVVESLIGMRLDAANNKAKAQSEEQ